MKPWFVLFGVAGLMVSTAAWSANYDVSVTRESANLYRVAGKQLFIHTRYCYEYATMDDAVLHMDGSSGSLIFLDDQERCDVKGVYGGVDQSPGKYSVSVSQDDDDWYEIDGTGLYVNTSMCLSVAVGEEALLKIDAGGMGTLYFLDDDDHCDVEGVYGALRL